MEGAILAAFLFYLVIIMKIGFIGARHTQTTEDFFLGGRKMNGWVVALSAVASGRSAWLCLGLAGISYKFGISAVWAVVGYILAELFMFVTLGKRLRRFTDHQNVVTIPGYLEERFKDKKHIICILANIIIIFFFFGYISAQLNAGGKALGNSFSQITDFQGVLITATIVIIYTALGGFVAVAWTDVIQAGFMILGLVVLPIVAIIELGGIEHIFQTLNQIELEVFKEAGTGMALNMWALAAGSIIGFICIGFGSPGNPHILVRYMSVDDPRHLRRCALVGTIWNVLMAWGAIFAGLAARVLLPEVSSLPEVLVAGVSKPDYDKAFLLLAEAFLHPVAYGFIIAAIFAAIMSTIDSQLLVVSSSITSDFYQRIFKSEASEKQMMVINRVSIVVIMIGAIIFSSVGHSVFWLVLLAWGGLGASLGPLMILSLYWKRTTLAGGVAGIAVGALVTVVWKFAPQFAWARTNIIKYELVPAFILATLAIIIVSLMTKPPENTDELFHKMVTDKE